MPPDLTLLSTLVGSNYPCLEQISMVPKVFEPLKFDCSYETYRDNTGLDCIQHLEEESQPF